MTLAQRSPLARLLARLSGLGTRTGDALGDAYARAAGTLLGGVERIEDRNAERRFARREKAAASALSHARRAARADDPPPPATSA